jgi:hypothetical protein
MVDSLYTYYAEYFSLSAAGTGLLYKTFIKIQK